MTDEEIEISLRRTERNILFIKVCIICIAGIDLYYFWHIYAILNAQINFNSLTVEAFKSLKVQ